MRRCVKISARVNPARRHFFHVVSALAGAGILSTLSNEAKAFSGRPVPWTPPGHGGPSCFLRGTRILTSRGAEARRETYQSAIVLWPRARSGQSRSNGSGGGASLKACPRGGPITFTPVRVVRSALAGKCTPRRPLSLPDACPVDRWRAHPGERSCQRHLDHLRRAGRHGGHRVFPHRTRDPRSNSCRGGPPSRPIATPMDETISRIFAEYQAALRGQDWSDRSVRAQYAGIPVVATTSRRCCALASHT